MVHRNIYGPRAERAEGLRRTLILSISQKLEQLDSSNLKVINLVVNQMIQQKKNDFGGKVDEQNTSKLPPKPPQKA